MSAYAADFRRGAVSPVACIQRGWQAISGQYWLFLGITAAGILIGSVVPFSILLGAMMCGIHICLLRRFRGEPVTFDLLFKGFDYFVPSLVATIVQVVPIVVVLVMGYLVFFIVVIGAAAAAPGGGEPAVALSIFVAMGLFVGAAVLVSLLVSLLFTFAYPLVADRGMGGVDACRTSAKAAVANLGGLVGLWLLLALMGIAGALLCYVGLLFVLPVSFAALAAAYREVFPDVARPAPYGFNPPPPPQYGAPYGYPPQ